MDCSGFTQLVYKMSGLALPRDACDQVETGVNVASVEASLPGDLAFFEKEDGSIIHTGIMLENMTIIHASGQVRIDKIDDHGIYSSTDHVYTHVLQTIKRMALNS
jgi:cell wall-associated NlpC family hydrolase